MRFGGERVGWSVAKLALRAGTPDQQNCSAAKLQINILIGSPSFQARYSLAAH
jgi:hypothetical protein